MSFLRRRSATPAGPDFDVLAMDPGDWPGNLGAGLLPAPDGSCQGVFLRYDLFGGRGPAMIIGNLPEGSPARELAEGQIPFEVAQLLAALENDEPVEVLDTEDVPVMQGDNLLIVRRLKLSESRISCVQFDRSDNVLVTIASWDRPITDDLYALLKPLPAELFQQGLSGAGAMSARVDAWIWAVRLTKTRSQAAAACRAGHVRVNGERAKPAQPVKPGDEVRVYVAGRERIVEVRQPLTKRVGPPVAAEAYVDNSPPPPPREHVALAAVRDRGAGRPTKRERRELDELRGRDSR